MNVCTYESRLDVWWKNLQSPSALVFIDKLWSIA